MNEEEEMEELELSPRPSLKKEKIDSIKVSDEPRPGFPLHSLYSGKKGYVCVVARLPCMEVKLRVSKQELWLAVSVQPPSGKEIAVIAGHLKELHAEDDGADFDQEWVAQGCHRIQSATYSIPLDRCVEATNALIQRCDGDKYVVFYIPYQLEEAVWI